jgi:RNA polymerase sigma-70 factor, ECF subfamily
MIQPLAMLLPGPGRAAGTEQPQDPPFPMPDLPPPDAPSDAELLGSVAAADRDAFVLLFERYAGRIKGLMMRSGASASDADEIVQDVMVSIWRRAASFDPARAAASTWIFAIARHRRIDLIRARGRAVLDPEDPLLRQDPEVDGFTMLDAAEREARLRAALADLPAEQRAVLVASFYDGLSHAAIAEREGLPLGTVKSRIRLAFRRLSAILGDDLAEGM